MNILEEEFDVNESCLWVCEDDTNTWNACGDNIFDFYADGPIDNGFRYCPYCGKHILEEVPINEN